MILQFRLIAILFATLLSSCSNEEIPAYLKEYKKDYLNNPGEANLNWFKNAKYGMFIHYGLYCNLEKGEWVQLRDTIKRMTGSIKLLKI